MPAAKKARSHKVDSGTGCSKHSAVIDLLTAGAFFHPDYTVGVGIPGWSWSPHSCLATLAVAVLAGFPIPQFALSDHRRSGIEITLSPCPEGTQLFDCLYYSWIRRKRQV